MDRKPLSNIKFSMICVTICVTVISVSSAYVQVHKPQSTKVFDPLEYCLETQSAKQRCKMFFGEIEY